RAQCGRARAARAGARAGGAPPRLRRGELARVHPVSRCDLFALAPAGPDYECLARGNLVDVRISGGDAVQVQNAVDDGDGREHVVVAIEIVEPGARLVL